jgi:hypothetical protein
MDLAQRIVRDLLAECWEVGSHGRFPSNGILWTHAKWNIKLCFVSGSIRLVQ